MVGKLTTIYGPMFAGKTTEIQNICRVALESGKKILLAKYSLDRRYTVQPVIINHDGDKLDSMKTLNIVEITESMELVDILNNKKHEDVPDMLVIDEVQFYKDIAQTIDIFKTDSRYKNMDIVLAGLDLDAECDTFNTDFNYLIAIADIAIYKLAECYICKKTAMYTVRFDDDNDNEQNQSRIKIAGATLYQPTCVLHHPSLN